MPILSFWSGDKKETAQTLSLIAIATSMSVDHNYKTLIVDACFCDDTMPRCFWKQEIGKELKEVLNRGKTDLVAGTEGLMSAVASNKTTPEIIKNYTKVIFKNRLDLLLGLKTTDYEEYKKTLELYPDVLSAANKFYDLVIVDLPKAIDVPTTLEILKMSDITMYTMSQNLKQIDKFVDNRTQVKELKSVIPIIGNTNVFCKYNPKNVSRYVKDKELAFILYNNAFLEAASEADVARFFLSTRISKNAKDRNSQFLTSVADASEKVIRRFEQLKYGKVLEEES